jgi:hypothetical protein
MSTVHHAARAHCFGNGLDRCAVCRVALAPPASGMDRTQQMLWGHITCQKAGQAACPFRNKCGGCTAQSPYVMLRPLAYVTGNKPCGRIRPSAERGAEALRIEPGHASIPDPCLGYDTPSPGTLLWVVQSSLDGVRTLSNGSGLLYFGGPGCAHRGPAPSGPDGVVSENATLTAHEIPLGLFSMRLRVVTQASCLHTVVRGTSNPRYRQRSIPIRGRTSSF